MTTKLILYPNIKLWMAAIKPPMYCVAIMPIWVGTAVAFAETKMLNAAVFCTFLAAAIFILAWENLSNDVFDSDTGIDINKHHSLVNLTGNRQLIFWLGNCFLSLGLLGILAISWWQQDLTLIGIILLCCGLGYLYQGPPFRLGYQGLGEVLCFFAFGPLGVAAGYYSQTQSWSLTSLAASLNCWYCHNFDIILFSFSSSKRRFSSRKTFANCSSRDSERFLCFKLVNWQYLRADIDIYTLRNFSLMDAFKLV